MVSRTVALFVLLDVALVVCLLSMLLCLHPFKFDFVSEWMRQCKNDSEKFVLPYLLVVLLILVTQLQLHWMFLVSLHHLAAAAYLHGHDEHAGRRKRHVDARTYMLVQLCSKAPHDPRVCATGHSDEAFLAGIAVVVGIVAIVYYDWTSRQSWLHFYGVALFCAGFFVTLQIIWWNLQKASSVATLRHMKPLRGMHWVVDTVIVLACLLFLTTNYLLGQTGAVVVSSELVAFAFLMLQFVYLFYICCCSAPVHLPTRSSCVSLRLWFFLFLLSPFLMTGKL
jgi:hypothetical protein